VVSVAQGREIGGAVFDGLHGIEARNITFDCADPTALATFWADVFGYPHPGSPEDLREQTLAGGFTE
jgi:hypothetical protein